ncbi:ABC transporter permease [bacterium]|nr:ABC transporter permease [bacterium]
MSGFIAFAKKEIMHIKRDPIIIFFCLVLPCIQLLLLGFAIDFDVRHVSTAVVDQSHSRESRELLDKLHNTQYLDITSYNLSRHEALRRLDKSECKIVIVIPPDYARTLKAQALVDGSDAQVSQRVVAALRNLYTADAAQTALRYRQLPQVNASILYNPAAKTNIFMLPGLIGIILQIITIVLTALSIVKEKEQGTMEQVTVSPVSIMGMMLGKIMPYAVMALCEVQIILYVSWLIFDLHIKGSWLQLMIMTIPFLMTTLSLGIFISTLANNQGQAFMMVIMIMLPSILLSGFVFPTENLPLPLQMVSQIVPVTHYLLILRGVIIRGVGILELWQPTCVLLGMAAILIIVATQKFRQQVV